MKRYKLGTHRGARRLWIEGKRLAACGFSRGRAFSATLTSDAALELALTPDGDRHVAGTDARPIVDILTHAFSADVTHLMLEFGEGRIRATPEHGDV